MSCEIINLYKCTILIVPLTTCHPNQLRQKVLTPFAYKWCGQIYQMGEYGQFLQVKTKDALISPSGKYFRT